LPDERRSTTASVAMALSRLGASTGTFLA
jgi:hypothetical protein